MGPGAGILLPMMFMIFIIGFAVMGFIFFLELKVVSRSGQPISIADGFQFLAIKRGAIVGLLAASLYAAAILSDAFLHTNFNTNKLIPRLGHAIFFIAFFPLALRCLEGAATMSRQSKIAVAACLSLAPPLLFLAIGFITGKH